MALPVDARTMMAAGHALMSQYQGKTADLYKFDGITPAGAIVTGGAGLPVLVRQPTRNEQAFLQSIISAMAEFMFEVARQGTVDLSQLLPVKHAWKYGGVFWEIINVQIDDAETTALGKTSGAVYVMATRRLQSDIGRKTGF
jgi:hypothetical protein